MQRNGGNDSEAWKRMANGVLSGSAETRAKAEWTSFGNASCIRTSRIVFIDEQVTLKDEIGRLSGNGVSCITKAMIVKMEIQCALTSRRNALSIHWQKRI